MEIVTIFIENKQKRLLIQKRSLLKGGKYGITSGHTLIGEEPKKGAIREIQEELGIHIMEKELKQIYKIQIGKTVYNLYYVYKNIKLEEIILQKEEVQDVTWCTREEINNLIQKNEFYEKQIDAYKIFEKDIKEEF